MKRNKKILFLSMATLALLGGILMATSYKVSRKTSDEMILSMRDDYYFSKSSLRIYSVRGAGLFWLHCYEHKTLLDQSVCVTLDLKGDIISPEKNSLKIK